MNEFISVTGRRSRARCTYKDDSGCSAHRERKEHEPRDPGIEMVTFTEVYGECHEEKINTSVNELVKRVLTSAQEEAQQVRGLLTLIYTVHAMSIGSCAKILNGFASTDSNCAAKSSSRHSKGA